MLSLFFYAILFIYISQIFLFFCFCNNIVIYILNIDNAIIKLFTQQPKLLESPNIIDLTSLRQAKKVSQVVDAEKNSNSLLYIVVFL